MCWFSRAQNFISMSEAQYVAFGDAVKKFLLQVWRCFPIFRENQGAEQLSLNFVTSEYQHPYKH